MDLFPLPINKQVSFDGKKKIEFVKELHAKVCAHIEKKTKLYADNANKWPKRVIFEPNDWVWEHISKERFPNKHKSKLHPKGDGPFKCWSESMTILTRLNFEVSIM